MLYYLFEFLDQNTNLPGTGLFQYISVRSALAFDIYDLWSQDH